MICAPCKDAGDHHAFRVERIECGCDERHARCIDKDPETGKQKTSYSSCDCQCLCIQPPVFAPGTVVGPALDAQVGDGVSAP